VLAVTDYQKTVPEQVARFVGPRFVPLGTDGYGRSDTRAALRSHFEVDAANITVAMLEALAREDRLPRHVVTAALEQYEIRTERPDPRLL
jgi:pyruvate dehydrogenase E1 component